MSAPVLILRARGAQDVSLIVNPEVTFFKTSYAKHSNFAFEDLDIQQNAGSSDWGNEVTFQLTRSGDLVSQVMLAFDIDRVTARPGEETKIEITTANPLTDATVQAKLSPYWEKIGTGPTAEYVYKNKLFVDDLARAMIDRVVLSIGGYDIEELTGQFLHVWDHLSRPADKSRVDTLPAAHGGSTRYREDMFGGYVGEQFVGLSKETDYFEWEGVESLAANTLPMVNTGANQQRIYVPLDFSFSSAYGLCLPMIALQFHDVKLRVRLRRLEEVSKLSNSNGTDAYIKDDGMQDVKVKSPSVQTTLLARYFFVDDAERRQFALNEHQYLITETQHQEFSVNTSQDRQTYSLYLNHPIKELLLWFRKTAYEDDIANYWNLTMDGSAASPLEAVQGAPAWPQAFRSMNLSLNQQKLYGDGRDPMYFGYLMPSQFHTRVPPGKERVYVMPFSLDPETWKPCGTINFSRIDTVQLELNYDLAGGKNLPPGTWHVYARNFNELRIKSGMGGKRFAS